MEITLGNVVYLCNAVQWMQFPSDCYEWMPRISHLWNLLCKLLFRCCNTESHKSRCFRALCGKRREKLNHVALSIFHNFLEVNFRFLKVFHEKCFVDFSCEKNLKPETIFLKRGITSFSDIFSLPRIGCFDSHFLWHSRLEEKCVDLHVFMTSPRVLQQSSQYFSSFYLAKSRYFVVCIYTMSRWLRLC